jgi:two-component system, chemotaxis family, sensor kinase CheA
MPTQDPRDQRLVLEFVQDSLESLGESDLAILKLASGTPQPAVVDHLFRLIHSIKGNAGFFGGFQAVRRLGHLTEEVLDIVRRRGGATGPDEQALLSEGTQLLAQALRGQLAPGGEPAAPLPAELAFADKVGEFRTGATRPTALPAPTGSAGAEAAESPGTIRVEAAGLAAVGREIAAIRDGLEELTGRAPEAQAWHQRAAAAARALSDLRAVPLHRLFDRLPGTVRSLAETLGKSVAVETDGGELQVDRSLADVLDVAVVHLLRNSLDHGIERQDVRVRRGKPAVGRVAVRACIAGSRLRLHVEDDGGGIDPKRLRMEAVVRKLMSEAEAAQLTDDEAIALVFRPGFSTAQTTSELSGRGVGMDAVLTGVRKLGGEVRIQSNPRRGTIVILDLPTEPRLS